MVFLKVIPVIIEGRPFEDIDREYNNYNGVERPKKRWRVRFRVKKSFVKSLREVWYNVLETSIDKYMSS